jgi:hypothetical protein
MCKIFLQYCFCNLLLDLELDLHLTETFFKLLLEIIRFRLKVYGHFVDLGLIDPILRALLNHFVHLD